MVSEPKHPKSPYPISSIKRITMFGLSEEGSSVLFFSWPHPENRKLRRTIDSIDAQIDFMVIRYGYKFYR
jgi:hypothetical protein